MPDSVNSPNGSISKFILDPDVIYNESSTGFTVQLRNQSFADLTDQDDISFGSAIVQSPLGTIPNSAEAIAAGGPEFVDELVISDLNQLGITISESGELSFEGISDLTDSFGNDPYVITVTYDITSPTSYSSNLFRIQVPEFENNSIVEGDLVFTLLIH